MKDIEINAVGSFEPGEYDHVEIDGVGKCTGPFTAREVEVNGVLNCAGTVQADQIGIDGTFSCVDRLDVGRMEVNGAATVEGDAGVENLEVDGALTVRGLLECTSIECDGAVTVKGDVTSGTIEVDGAFTAKGNIAADTVEVDGKLETDGQVSADNIEVDGIIKAAEVVGDKVCIDSCGGRRKVTIIVGGLHIGHSVQSGPARMTSLSKVGLIEATDIELAGVSADVVNGTNIVIGPGCDIGKLDCNGTLELDPSSRVGEITGDHTLRG